MNIEQPTSNPDSIGKDRTRRRVLVPCVLGALAVGILLCTSNAGAQSTNSSGSSPDFSSFKIITQRNIFDPNRRGFGTPYRPGPTHTRHVVDAFALVGTMSYEKGKFAFFDGEGSQYKRVVEPGAIIAGYTVKDIAPKAVTLAANGKEFQMNVGSQLRNEGADGWRLSARTDVSSDSSNSDQGDGTVAAQPTAPPAASSPEASDILKRLMEKRQQELK